MSILDSHFELEQLLLLAFFQLTALNPLKSKTK